MIELLELIRKIEVLFLPLFPKKWQNPPLTYRLIVPIIKRLSCYEERYSWMGVFLYSLRENIYPAYHRNGLIQDQISQREMEWIRFILAVVAFMLLIPFSREAHLLSPWIKGCLFWGSNILFIYGATHLSISIMWATWGLLFPIILALGLAPGLGHWAMAFLATWGLLWHIPGVKGKRSWQLFEILSTLPILFFWVGNVGKMLHTWSLWQRGILFLIVWFSIWILLIRKGHHLWISKFCQFFWPSSLTTVPFIILAHPKLFGIFRWGLWLFGTIGLSLVVSKIAPRISARSFLFGWKSIVIVFISYVLLILISGTPSLFKEEIETGLLHLFNSLEFLWWVVGASIIISVRGVTLILLKWVQALLHGWLIPLALWILPVLVFGTDWFSPLIGEFGVSGAIGLWMSFTMGATLLTWRRRENMVREWMFWGFFAFFLFRQYWFDAHQLVDLYWRKTDVSVMGFITLAVWLLWLNYDALWKYLNRLREKIYGIGLVAFMGAMLWFLISLLWLSHVDQQFSIQGRINYALFRGFTYLGIPLIIYHLIMHQYLEKEPLENLPWWILIVAIGLVQVFQGIEHVVVARLEHQSFDTLQKELLDILLNGIPLDEVAPKWVMNFSWVFLWRLVRWVLAMATLSWILRSRNIGKASLRTVSIMMSCFTSLAVWTAEAVWLFWPSMPLEWAVIFRPWIQTTLIWDANSLKLYLLYLLAGLLWGWLFSSNGRYFPHFLIRRKR